MNLIYNPMNLIFFRPYFGHLTCLNVGEAVVKHSFSVSQPCSCGQSRLNRASTYNINNCCILFSFIYTNVSSGATSKHPPGHSAFIFSNSCKDSNWVLKTSMCLLHVVALQWRTKNFFHLFSFSQSLFLLLLKMHKNLTFLQNENIVSYFKWG